MGYDNNGNVVTIDAVVINTHGNPNVLGDGNGSWSLFATDIANLDNKDVGVLVLYGCNVGHLDYVDTNVASAFALKVNGAAVFASDGTVFAGRAHQWWIPSKYTWFLGSITYASRNDNAFNNLISDGPIGQKRDNQGWVIYRADGSGGVQTYNTGNKSMTLVDMARMSESVPIYGPTFSGNNFIYPGWPPPLRPAR